MGLEVRLEVGPSLVSWWFDSPLSDTVGEGAAFVEGNGAFADCFSVCNGMVIAANDGDLVEKSFNWVVGVPWFAELVAVDFHVVRVALVVCGL